MDSQITLPRPARFQNMGCLTLYALLGVGIFLVLLYDFGRIFPDFLNPMFASPAAMLGTIVVATIIGLSTVRWGVGHWSLKSVLALGIAVMLAFPALLPALYPPYVPYAEPASGYTLEWITQPANAWMSAFKSAQRHHDTHGCTYTLHGWSADQVLYFGSSCRSGVWRYDPTDDSQPQWIGALPDDVELSEVDRGRHHPSGGIAYPTPPLGFSEESRFDFIPYEVARSQDQRWTAVAIMNWYGPRDVVILSAAD